MNKKNLKYGPSDIEGSIEAHKKLMKRKPEIDQEFFNFLKEETARLFSNYRWSTNDKFVLPNSSYCQGGEDIKDLHNWAIESDLSRPEFNNFIENDVLEGKFLDLYNDFLSKPNLHKVKVVVDGGKTRVITTNHPCTMLMKNLQWSVHGYLRKMPTFKYIGAQVNNFVKMPLPNEKEWLLSGDYSNSTDFIPTEYTRSIYDIILGKIEGHYNLKRIVRHNLEKEILEYPDGEVVEMKSGQLMGGLLSFPALCVVNHCISKYLDIKKKKINGDDLLAWCTRSSRDLWFELSESLGMTPNKSKSHFNPYYGTFNSMLLKKRKDGELVRLPHISTSKLAGSSLKDWLGLNLDYKYRYGKYLESMSRVWFYNRPRLDLYTGDRYTGRVRRLLWKYSPALARFGHLCSFFVGQIGSFSLFYDPNDVEKMIEKCWVTKQEGEFFFCGNTMLLTLDNLMFAGDKDARLIINFLKKNKFNNETE